MRRSIKVGGIAAGGKGPHGAIAPFRVDGHVSEGIVAGMQSKADLLEVVLALRLAAASRTFWTAGSSRPIRMAMMAMTTSNSISVKALRLGSIRFIGHPLEELRSATSTRPGTAFHLRIENNMRFMIPGRGSASQLSGRLCPNNP